MFMKAGTRDFETIGGGAVVFIVPRSEAATEWVAENCAVEPWQWQGNSFAVDSRYAEAILEAAQDDGLSVE